MSKSNFYRCIAHYTFLIFLTGFLVACNTEELNNIFPNTISGSVGDGPITQAQISVTDANGSILGASISDSSANYSVSIPPQSNYPIFISATGGTDVVTGAEPDFVMVSVATDTSVKTVNINPFSTLIVKTAQAMPGGLTPSSLIVATQYVMSQLSFGLDPALMPNPITTSINENNVAAIIKASEALGETIRRTRSALLVSGVDLDENLIISTIAADMVDGVLDGVGQGANAQVAATINVVSGQVLLEALSNQLEVGGADATARMDFAIKLSVATAVMTTDNVMITDGILIQARKSLAATQAFSPNSDLATVAMILAGMSGNMLATDVDAALPGGTGVVFSDVISAVTTASDNQWEMVNASIRSGNIDSNPMPTPPVAPIPVNPGVFEFALAEYSVSEDGGFVDVIINRVNGMDGEVTLEWKTQQVSATFGEDYGSFQWTPLTFVDGESSKTESIAIVDDSLVEGEETFNILLRDPTTGNVSLGTQIRTTVTITDNDIAAPTPTPIPVDRPWENLVQNIGGYGEKTTGGMGGEACWVTTLSNSGAGSLRDCAERSGAQWILFSVSGIIDLGASRINMKSNKTIDGRGADITIIQGGLNVVDVDNIIIHNIKFDSQAGKHPFINIYRRTTRVWVNHVSFSGSTDDALQIGGAVNSSVAPSDITVSWSYWTDLNLAIIVGFAPELTNDKAITVTMHHNFFHGNHERGPRLRYGKVHSFNNYYLNGAGPYVSQEGYFLSEGNIYNGGYAYNGKIYGGIVATSVGTDPLPPIAVKSVGDVASNGAVIRELNPEGIFVPSYETSITVTPANSVTQAEIESSAGWQVTELP